MKPRLADAPNGILGASTSRGRGDLLGQATGGGAAKHHSEAATVPVDLLGGEHSAPRPKEVRVSLDGNRKTHRRTRSDQASPEPERSGAGGEKTMERVRRGSYRATKVIDNRGPLQQDTRQQELVKEAAAAEKGEKGGGGGGGGLFPTFRGRTPRQSRRPDGNSSLDASSATTSDVSLLMASDSAIFGGGSLDSERSSQRGGGGGTSLGKGSGAAAVGAGNISPRGSGRKSIVNVFTRSSGTVAPLGGQTPTVRKASPHEAPVALSSIPAGPRGPSPRQPAEKKVGFFAKLKARAAGNTTKKHEAAQVPKNKIVFSAAELEAREAQLQAAGFEQLPGTLLSRAKGDDVDKKYLLKWNQFELTREIGEGAYAMVYLAKVSLDGGAKKDVALKELKLQGNEQSEDIHLEAALVADAVADCGFVQMAETIRVASDLLRRPLLYEQARLLVQESLAEFRKNVDLEDEACGAIMSVMEALAALPPPPPSAPSTSSNSAFGGVVAKAVKEEDVGKKAKTAPERLVEDVMREVEVLSKLWHKNIVEFVGTCVELPHLAIAMQYAHKGPLSEILINEDVVLGWDLRVKWAKETAEAIHYLHSLDPKIIHRDLKADNILIDSNNTALVTDFGLSKAKVLNKMNPVGAPLNLAGRKVNHDPRNKYKSFVEFSEIAGTPSYMAPELWRNESYTEAVDVYSFAVVLWELVARDAPYRELDNEKLMVALRDKHLRPTIPKWVPEAYRLLTERCWADLPSTRPNFDQIMKLLKILEEKHIFAWIPPENYSLDEHVQAEYMISWAKEKEEKEQAMKAAERKLMQAQQQFKSAKTLTVPPNDHTSSSSSSQQTSPRKSVSPHASVADHHKSKKTTVSEVFLK